ncbi:Rha family transcriptional regulator [Bacillus thuringiensis]|uniref:Rha family transcriptional regulator n=1 Tax=Bacillus thuringiensis serovar andalousiensis TaxID=257985 RepID=A0A6H0TL69_BACTU|nr:Rha family transcriptional regulator [Bacillus thuringiensis]QIW21217.1 Rha family transcriptional regulator [Bacillus thuringiensis serovar andalousiensis]
MMQESLAVDTVSHLVYLEGNALVTDSITVAAVFGKEHAKVIRSIEELQSSKEFTDANFGVSEYRDRSGKRNKKYLIKRDGLMFLVMGYTGEKAAKMKENYIREFNRMEEYIRGKPKAMNAKESILANMKLTIELNEEVTSIKEDVTSVKEDMEQIKKDINERITLDYGQQQVIRNAVNKRVHKLWNENRIDKEIHNTTRKVYSSLWKNLKDAYQVNAYPNILQKDFDEALSFIEGWRPLFNGNKTA